MTLQIRTQLGWHRDLPDPRDITPGHERLEHWLASLEPYPVSGRRVARGGMPPSVDWTEFFDPACEPVGLAASVPCAALALAQSFERKAHGRRLDGSIRFLYKMARQLQGWAGDAGSTPRVTLKALARFGLPPAGLCPHDLVDFDRPLEPFLFGYREANQGLGYVRLDGPGDLADTVLRRVRGWLASGFPILFGFVAFDSIGNGPDIPFPTAFSSPLGGLAVVASGYDDNYRFRSSRGALRVRNCWGDHWGESGYGWLPYAYVERGLAADFWTLVRPDWLATGEFRRPPPG